MRDLFRETKWLRFFIVERKPKTIVMSVENRDGEILGSIKWYGGWRQYIFLTTPGYGFRFNNGCLEDIAGVLTTLNEDHKEKQDVN